MADHFKGFSLRSYRRIGISMKLPIKLHTTVVITILMTLPSFVLAQSPWGNAQQTKREYHPQKVVYDVATSSINELAHAIDRVSSLNNLAGADPFESSIVIVLHGPEVKFFTHKNYSKYKVLMDRAQSLTVGSTIKFKMGQLTAEWYGFKPKDIHGFVELIPMGDAEIIRLQVEERYAYMR